MMGLLSLSCNGQKNELEKTETNQAEKNLAEHPNESWKVEKEFDDRGNLIRYDSIYSWSSTGGLTNFSKVGKDSLLQSFKSRFFTNFSDIENNGFDDVFTQDSLFSKFFYSDDFFGSNFMEMDIIRQQMLERQKKIIEKYHLDFIKAEDEN